MQAQTFQPPKWWYTGQRPTTDDAYFENMSRIIFHAGLNWQVIKAKWPSIQQAFAYFSVDKVAKFGDREVELFLTNSNVIRHRGKIQAIILNARQFQTIRKQYGSFQKYLDGLDKSKNYTSVVKELTRRFHWLGPPSTRLFLHSVGENIQYNG